MAETLNFGEAARRAGVSRQRLNQAIKAGRLPATRGGGPGKPTTIQLDDLQAWCLSEGLAMPVETSERPERSPYPAMANLILRLDHMFTEMQRLEQLMEHVLKRLEGPQAPAIEASQSSPELQDLTTNPPVLPTDRAALMQRLRAMKAEGLSLQAMAHRFNLEGVPTLSGKGQWQKGTIGNLLTQQK
jgi:hypothetical protein